MTLVIFIFLMLWGMNKNIQKKPEKLSALQRLFIEIRMEENLKKIFFIRHCYWDRQNRDFYLIEKIYANQIINYLKVFNIEVGILINFGTESLQVKCFINNKL